MLDIVVVVGGDKEKTHARAEYNSWLENGIEIGEETKPSRKMKQLCTQGEAKDKVKRRIYKDIDLFSCLWYKFYHINRAVIWRP